MFSSSLGSSFEEITLMLDLLLRSELSGASDELVKRFWASLVISFARVSVLF
jgi:hypothetical protein